MKLAIITSYRRARAITRTTLSQSPVTSSFDGSPILIGDVSFILMGILHCLDLNALAYDGGSRNGSWFFFEKDDQRPIENDYKIGARFVVCVGGLQRYIENLEREGSSSLSIPLDVGGADQSLLRP